MRKGNILSLLKLKPSPQSTDFVENKRQFQLHTLLTEQRHPQTWNLSLVIKEDVKRGLEQILSVDEDISRKIHQLIQDPVLLEQASRAVGRAIRQNQKIFIYGCGSTGRLAKQIESALWRPFWTRLKDDSVWEKLKLSLPLDIEDRLIGEMTGGDRALISALEGLEDLELIGRLQLADRGVGKGDVVFCITEGGETSSVIGAILAAYDQHEPLTAQAKEDARNNLYFIYNNPDDVLKPFDRSRRVIENPDITKINLTTGPQAITGSTRMQATTIETYIMGVILEEGIRSALEGLLIPDELAKLGFSSSVEIEEKLLAFEGLRNSLLASIEDIAQFTALEAQTYAESHHATYLAEKALITVFIDCAERSPTFHLYPLDTVLERQRNCWYEVWTKGRDYREAWRNFLGRGFRGLDEAFYKPHFQQEIDDPYLREAALKSLSRAGNEQERLYDLAFAPDNVSRRGPQEGDLGVVVCVDEEVDELPRPGSSFFQFLSLLKEKKASAAVLLVSSKSPSEIESIIQKLSLDREEDIVFSIALDDSDDPLRLKRQTVLKILLNAHSTGVMACLGRVVGNTMTNVNPSNLKLIGRATYLIMSHVNDTISQEEWITKYGVQEPLAYGEANAVLFDAIDFVARHGGQMSEVEIAVIRILEALKRKRDVSWDEALSRARADGLEKYLGEHNPILGAGASG